MSEDFDKYYEATEPGMRERAYAWATSFAAVFACGAAEKFEVAVWRGETAYVEIS